MQYLIGLKSEREQIYSELKSVKLLLALSIYIYIYILYVYTLTHLYLSIYLSIYLSTGPDSSSGKGSALGAIGRGLEAWPRHTNGIKMVLATPLLALELKGSNRKGSHKTAHELILSV